MTAMTVGQPMATWILSDLRKRTGKSLQDVGDAMGVNKFRISQIERDYPNITLTVMLRYMDALGAGVVYQVEGEVVRSAEVVQDASRAAAREKKRAAGREAIARNVGSV